MKYLDSLTMTKAMMSRYYDSGRQTTPLEVDLPPLWIATMLS
jgi:hypothetical protein